MRCPTCGFSIDQANLTQCPNCGNALPAPAGQGEHASQGGQGPTPPEYQSYPAYPPPPDAWTPPVNDPTSYGAQPQGQSGSYGQPAPYSQPGYYGASAPPSGYGQPYSQPYGQSYGQPAPPSYPYAGAPGYPPAGYPPPLLAPLPVRKRRTGLIVGIVAAVVVVLAACTGVTAFALHSLGMTPVSSVPATATSDNNAPTPTTSPTSPTIIYQNTFASDDAGWLNDSRHCFWTPEGYHVVEDYSCYAPIGIQTDADIVVKVHQITGLTTWPYGIMFRLDSAGNDYQFVIDSNSKWAVFKCTSSNCSYIVRYTSNAAIKGGLNTTNTLEVDAKGSHFDFFVNATKVGSADDSTYPSGKIGLAVGSNVECIFTDLVISRPA